MGQSSRITNKDKEIFEAKKVTKVDILADEDFADPLHYTDIMVDPVVLIGGGVGKCIEYSSLMDLYNDAISDYQAHPGFRDFSDFTFKDPLSPQVKLPLVRSADPKRPPVLQVIHVNNMKSLADKERKKLEQGTKTVEVEAMQQELAALRAGQRQSNATINLMSARLATAERTIAELNAERDTWRYQARPMDQSERNQHEWHQVLEQVEEQRRREERARQERAEMWRREQEERERQEREEQERQQRFLEEKQRTQANNAQLAKEQLENCSVELRKHVQSRTHDTVLLDSVIADLTKLVQPDFDLLRTEKEIQKLLLDIYCCLAQCYLWKDKLTMAENMLRQASICHLHLGVAPFIAATADAKDRVLHLSIAQLDMLNGYVLLLKEVSPRRAIEKLLCAERTFQYYFTLHQHLFIKEYLLNTRIYLGMAYLKDKNFDQAGAYFGLVESQTKDQSYPLLAAGLGEMLRLHKVADLVPEVKQQENEIKDGDDEVFFDVLGAQDQQAYQRYQEAVREGEKEGNTLACMIGLNGMAILSYQKQELKDAKFYLTKLIDLYHQENDATQVISKQFFENGLRYLTSAYLYRGCVHFDLGDSKAALSDFTYLFQTLEYYRGWHDNSHLMTFTTGMQRAFGCWTRIQVEEATQEGAVVNTLRLNDMIKQAEAILNASPVFVPRARLDARHALAHAHLALGHVIKSKQYFDELVSKKSQGHLGRAQLNVKLNKFPDALSDCRVVLSTASAPKQDQVIARHILTRVAREMVIIGQAQQVLSEVLNNVDLQTWPPDEPSYRDALAYRVCAHLKLANEKGHIQHALGYYKNLKEISVSSLTEAEKLADQAMVDIFYKLTRINCYKLIAAVMDSLEKYHPQQTCQAALQHLTKIEEDEFAKKSTDELLNIAKMYFEQLEQLEADQFALERVIKITYRIIFIKGEPDSHALLLFAEAAARCWRYEPKDLTLVALLGEKNFAEHALTAYDQLIQQSNNNVNQKLLLKMQRGILAFRSGLRTDAEIRADLEPILQSRYCSSIIFAYLSAIEGRAVKPDLAKMMDLASRAKTLAKSQAEPEQIMIDYFYGEALRRSGEFQSALDIFLKVEKNGFVDLPEGELFARIGAIYLGMGKKEITSSECKQSYFTKADQYLQRATDALDKTPYKNLYAFAAAQKSDLYERQGKIVDAIDQAVAALSKNSNESLALTISKRLLSSTLPTTQGFHKKASEVAQKTCAQNHDQVRPN